MNEEYARLIFNSLAREKSESVKREYEVLDQLKEQTLTAHEVKQTYQRNVDALKEQLENCERI